MSHGIHRTNITENLFDPPMKYIISCSGGVGSAVSAILAWENNLDFEMVFADTLIEDEDLYRFNRDIEKLIGKPMTILCDGRTPWDVFIDRKFIGNSRLAHCSQELKTKQVKKYLEGKTGISLVLGMHLAEQDRIDIAVKEWSPVPVMSLLKHYKIHRPEHAQNIVRNYGIELPALYSFGFPHNNCGGFCVRGGQQQFVSLLEAFPERYAHHEREQTRAMEAIGATARPFIQMQRGGIKEYLTLTEFRELYQAGEITVNPFDYGGCGCFIE